MVAKSGRGHGLFRILFPNKNNHLIGVISRGSGPSEG
jgi:hypothetical protein